MRPPAFDPLRALEALLKHRVRFVLIGGFAARLLGSPTVTGDLDICYAREDENLGHLAKALVELGSRLRGAPDDAPFVLDAKSLKAGDHFTFVTDAGNLDCLGTPAGTRGFEELHDAALEMDLDGLTVRVASIDDLIRMKRAAGRPKDLIETEILGALREEIDQRAKKRGGAAHDALTQRAGKRQPGAMFWFRRKKFSGSYFLFSALRRSYFSAP